MKKWMQKAIQICLSFLFIGNLVSCASFTSPARKHELKKGEIYWFDYSSDRRGTIFISKDTNKNYAFCAEPSPDVALQIVDKFKAEIKSDKIPVSLDTDIGIQEQVIQLGKRTQTIMFLRESLYRLCELSQNLKLKDDDVVALYKQIIEAAANMAKAELLNAEQAQIKAKNKLIETMQKTPNLIDVYKDKLKKEDERESKPMQEVK